MQYVNETVVEVNVPAVVSKLHVKCRGHDSVVTHAHAILFISQSTAERLPGLHLSSKLLRVGLKQLGVEVMLAPKSLHLLLSNRWKHTLFIYLTSHSFKVERGGGDVLEVEWKTNRGMDWE